MKSHLKPFKISGPITLPHRIFPGPMEGVMSPLFCKTAEAFDLVDFWMTPFLRVTTGVIGKSKIRKFAERYTSSGKPVIIQIMGTDPELIINTAHRCKEMGFAGVNFNMACPSKLVISSGSGGALLKNYTFIKKLMEKSTELGEEFSLSLKIRTGFKSADEIEEIAKFAKTGNATSILDFVVIHHRTVSEGYETVPGREERLSKAVKAFGDIPVIANGDINSSDDAVSIVNKTNCAGVMVARNWLKNPNLIKCIQAGRNAGEEESKNYLASFIYAMAVNAQNIPRKRDKNSIIDMVSYIFPKDHPFFQYVIKIPFTDPSNELSKQKILDLI